MPRLATRSSPESRWVEALKFADNLLHSGLYDGPTQVGNAYVTFEPYAIGCP